MEKTNNKPPSAPLAAQYLIQHKCIYTPENITQMCGMPVAEDHRHYCQIHASAEKIRDTLLGFADTAIAAPHCDTAQDDPVKLALSLSGRC